MTFDYETDSVRYIKLSNLLKGLNHCIEVFDNADFDVSFGDALHTIVTKERFLNIVQVIKDDHADWPQLINRVDSMALDVNIDFEN